MSEANSGVTTSFLFLYWSKRSRSFGKAYLSPSTVFEYRQVKFMMDSGSEPMHQALSDLFRPSKRQRFYRKRTDKGGEDDACVTTDGAAISPEPMTVDDLISRNKDVGQGEGQQEDDGNDDQIPLSFAEVLRQRKASQRRRGGIEFTNLHSSNSAPHQSQPSGAPVLKEEDIPSDIKLVVERFAPQTGQGRVSDTADKHMYGTPFFTLGW